MWSKISILSFLDSPIYTTGSTYSSSVLCWVQKTEGSKTSNVIRCDRIKYKKYTIMVNIRDWFVRYTSLSKLGILLGNSIDDNNNKGKRILVKLRVSPFCCKGPSGSILYHVPTKFRSVRPRSQKNRISNTIYNTIDRKIHVSDRGVDLSSLSWWMSCQSFVPYIQARTLSIITSIFVLLWTVHCST